MNQVKIFLTLICVVAVFNTLSAQVIKDQQEKTTTDYRSISPGFDYKDKTSINADASDILSSLKSQQTFEQQNIVVEGLIEPDKYIVSQGDRFILGLYGYLNQLVPLTVNLEGSVVIPTVGEVKVSGLTLAEAKERVIEKVKKRYYSSDVSFNLSAPRNFLVRVTGLTQGTYPVTPLMRASDLLTYLMLDTNNLPRVYYETLNKQPNERSFFKTDISLRNIELVRKDGTIEKVDIYKYYINKDDKYNPFFIEGDLLRIPNTLIEKNYISITGAVQLGGLYEYSPGDDLETLVGLGRGFDAFAEPDSIMLFRPYEGKPGFEIINLSYSEDKDFKLNVFDRAFVRFRSDYQRMVTVLVLGEVKRPGFYPVAFNGTKLKQVIEMAGGLKESAYLPLSILFRYYDEEYVKKDSLEVAINMRANDVIVSEEDRKDFETDILAKRNRVAIDFEKLIFKNDTTQNIILQDKDIVYINDDKQIIYVFGQVMNEGYVPYIPGKDYEYYIEKAGGYGLAADEGNTRIIKFNSRGWYNPKDITLNSGDYIFVPKKNLMTFSEKLTLIVQLSGIVLGILTTYLLYKNTIK